MRHIFLLLPAVLVLSCGLHAQTTHRALSLQSGDSLRPVYFDQSAGLGYSNFRDFATSPLTYHGASANIGLYRVMLSDARESSGGVMFSFTGADEFMDSDSYAMLGRLDIRHTELFRVFPQTGERLNLKAGGSMMLTGMIRNNSAFYNNSFGSEAFGTLFASARVGLDLSRTKAKTIDLKLFRIKLIPRKRSLAFRLDAGVMNVSWRNGFNYMDNSSVVNDYNYYKRHELHWFDGYRMHSELAYHIHLNNGNAVKLAYLWDALYSHKTGERFEMAAHQLQLGFMFGLNEPAKIPEK